MNFSYQKGSKYSSFPEAEPLVFIPVSGPDKQQGSGGRDGGPFVIKKFEGFLICGFHHFLVGTGPLTALTNRRKWLPGLLAGKQTLKFGYSVLATHKVGFFLVLGYTGEE